VCPLTCLQASRGKKRLEFLLKQAEVFQHFAPASAAAAEKKKKRGRHGAAYTEEMEDEGDLGSRSMWGVCTEGEGGQDSEW
jgi:hypothetical protein